jgi:hypothetical protein
MKNLTNATRNTRVYDKFEYFAEDFDCQFCACFCQVKNPPVNIIEKTATMQSGDSCNVVY